MKRVVLLGATGSIGESALRVIAAHRGKLELAAVASRANWRRLAAIAHDFGVREVGIYEEVAYWEAKASGAFPPGTRIAVGEAGLVELARLPEADSVLLAVIGTTGLHPALAALGAGKELALASKEILLLAGKFVMAEAKAMGARILPIDSEHSAISQCIEGHAVAGIKRIVLTASGGALRDWPIERLAYATPADALRHPNWSMGAKITVDSATLANKGMELIEAKWLFDLRPDQCCAVLHPQSVIHCLVEFTDGVMLAQLSPPSMTFSIQHALLHPERAPGVDLPLDLNRLISLEIRPVDEGRYPMLRLAREAMQAGGIAPAVLNAANEVAVQSFLEGGLPFLAISRVVEETLAETRNFEPTDLNHVVAADQDARRAARPKVGSSR